MKTFKWSAPEPTHHQDSLDPVETKEGGKEMIVGALIMTLGYLMLFPLAELALDESAHTALFCTIIASVGLATTTVAGKNGIMGNLIASAAGMILFAMLYANKDPLWAIGLLFLGFYHLPILLGWGVGYGFYKKRKNDNQSKL
ncbi:hypothetical protein DDZ13_12965 [Coraliomargarita sinensis]|uniref:Uncharacterized protein n=1 Tax=Coraliomargarita sinensis TaxID=2174842 RepID=A0A317ZG51_9BACT|nr:hypothetical protein [Coraliomargarita sinensis]PXA03327.1 hypothetical protein DDZ13_12965 [Coraliomargarita sinensis]